MGRISFRLVRMAMFVIANLFLVPGNLAFKLIQDTVNTSLDVRPGIASDETFMAVGLDDNVHGIIEPFLGDYHVDCLYLIKELS